MAPWRGAWASRLESRWLGRPVEEKALEAPDFSATTDLYSIVSNVYTMNLMPLSLRNLADDRDGHASALPAGGASCDIAACAAQEAGRIHSLIAGQGASAACRRWRRGIRPRSNPAFTTAFLWCLSADGAVDVARFGVPVIGLSDCLRERRIRRPRPLPRHRTTVPGRGNTPSTERSSPSTGRNWIAGPTTSFSAAR